MLAQVRLVPSFVDAIALIMLLQFVGCSNGHVPGGRAPTSVVVSPSDLDLGELWEGSRVSRQISIRNASNEEVKIEAFQKSCGCVSVIPESLLISPNSTEVVSVTVDVPVSSTASGGAGLAQQIVPVVMDTNAVFEPNVWELRGRVRRLCEVSPPHIEIDESMSPTSSGPVAVELKSAMPLRGVEVFVENAPISATVTSKSDVNYKLAFELQDAPDSPQHFWGQAIIKCHLLSGEVIESRQLTVSGRQFRPIVASPSEVKLGFVGTGEHLTRQLSLKSVLGRPFSIHSAVSKSSEIDVDYDKTLSSEAHAVTLHLKTSVEGLQKTAVEFGLSIENQEDPAIVRIPVEYICTRSITGS